MDKTEIFGLTLITSSTCNLNCEYCFLHKNEAYKLYNQNIKESINNGSYFTNISNTFQTMGWDKEKISQISFWGGETLIHIENIQKHLPIIFSLFPNVNNFLLSTNFSINIEKFFNFLVDLNKLANNRIVVNLQLSIDGPNGSSMRKQGHNVKEEIYYKNMETFCNLVNNIQLKNLEIHVSIRPTISKNLYLTELNTYDKIKNYLTPFYEFIDVFASKCISKSLMFSTLDIWPVLATPYYESSKDGRLLQNIERLWFQVVMNEFKDIPLRKNVTLFQGGNSFDKNPSMFQSNNECSELKHSITINYDGTICECSGSYIDHFEPYQQELLKTGENELYKVATAHSKMVNYNPLTNPEIIEEKKWYVHDGGYRNTHFIGLTSIILLAEELALSGQISSIYLYDKEKLLKHSLMLLNNSCSRNNIAQTFSPYIKPVGELRRYFNGTMENIDQMESITRKILMEKER